MNFEKWLNSKNVEIYETFSDFSNLSTFINFHGLWHEKWQFDTFTLFHSHLNQNPSWKLLTSVILSHYTKWVSLVLKLKLSCFTHIIMHYFNLIWHHFNTLFYTIFSCQIMYNKRPNLASILYKILVHKSHQNNVLFSSLCSIEIMYYFHSNSGKNNV